MVLQSADEFHGALSEALDGLLEIRQSIAALALGVLVPLDEGLRFAFDLGFVADAGLLENEFFYESHQVMGQA